MESGYGSQTGDIFLSTSGSIIHYPQVMLVAAGIGTGNYNYTCPLYKAAQKVMNMFVKNKHHVLDTKSVTEHLFDLDTDSIITYSVPEWYSSPYIRLDLAKSKNEFLGMRVRQDFDEPLEEFVWLCGPDNEQYAEMFGKEAYKKRRKLFGHIYDMAAATNPIQMSNPIFPGENGLSCITRGKQNAYHQ